MAAADRWARMRAIVESALERPPAERAALLEEACAGDAGLLVDASRLLDACERAETAPAFLAPDPRLAAPVLDALALASVRAAFAERYDVECELARGGMAAVFLGHDRRHERAVAIKLLLPEPGASLSAERFEREIRVTASLVHPHVVPLFESGVAAGMPFFVMPFLGRESLRERLRHGPPLPVEDAVRIAAEIASALEHAHRRGVVHRDIKPENVLLVDGHAVVADFGVARASELARSGDSALRTRTGTSLGTPAYMAPEQASGHAPVDHAADLYALGLVLHEMLAGSHPFGDRAPEAMVAAHLLESPPELTTRRPGLPPELCSLVRDLLRKEPAHRPRSASEVIARLADVSRGPRRRSGGRVAVAATAVAALALAGLALSAWRRDRVVPARTSASVATGVDARVVDVAVLPFGNAGGDPDGAAWSAGLTEELAAALAREPGLRVKGRMSLQAMRGAELEAREVASRLAVGWVVRGSASRVAERRVVTAELLDAAGRVRWNGRYESESGGLLALREALSREVRRAVRAEAGLRQAGATEGARSPDPAAYVAFLRGRFVFHSQVGRDGALRAARYFEDAIALDPTYARSHAGLADAYVRLAIFGYGRAMDDFARAEAAAMRAVALDEQLAEGHAALGHVLNNYRFDRRAAEREFRRALALDPGYVFARAPFSMVLLGQGRFAEAIAQLDTGRALDPLAPVFSNLLGRAYVAAGDADRAIGYLQEALVLNPQIDLAHQLLGHAYLAKGMRDEAIAAFRTAAATRGARDSAHLAYGLARVGRPDEARAILDRLLAVPQQEVRLAFHLAMAHTALGQHDAAMRLLLRGADARASFMDGVMITSAFAPLRSDPRWPRLLAAVRLDPP